jgi:hypothetical protein
VIIHGFLRHRSGEREPAFQDARSGEWRGELVQKRLDCGAAAEVVHGGQIGSTEGANDGSSFLGFPPILKPAFCIGAVEEIFE